jgi:hypothetical protein
LRERAHLVAGEPVEDVGRGVGGERARQGLPVGAQVGQGQLDVDVRIACLELVHHLGERLALCRVGHPELDVQRSRARGHRQGGTQTETQSAGPTTHAVLPLFHLVSLTNDGRIIAAVFRAGVRVKPHRRAVKRQ